MNIRYAEATKVDFHHNPRELRTNLCLTFSFQLECRDEEEAKEAVAALRERLKTFEGDFNNYQQQKIPGFIANTEVKDRINDPSAQVPDLQKALENSADPIDSLEFPDNS